MSKALLYSVIVLLSAATLTGCSNDPEPPPRTCGLPSATVIDALGKDHYNVVFEDGQQPLRRDMLLGPYQCRVSADDSQILDVRARFVSSPDYTESLIRERTFLFEHADGVGGTWGEKSDKGYDVEWICGDLQLSVVAKTSQEDAIELTKGLAERVGCGAQEVR